MHPLLLRTVLIGFSFLCYFAFFTVNTFFFSNSHFSAGVNWFFLPAGLRLLLTLVLAEDAALGISLASMVISFSDFFKDDLITGFGAGILSGLAPYIAYCLVIKQYGIGHNLSNINYRNLFLCIVLFALISPLMHQVWFVSRGYTTDFLSSLTVMMVGDLLGSLLIVYSAKSLIFLRKIMA
jgi:hypothetical protein